MPDVFTYDFKDSTTKERSQMLRGVDSNKLTYQPGKTGRPREWRIPFRYSDQLLVKLLIDTLKREVSLISMKLPLNAKYLYSSVVPDSLYKVMMQASDNFIAEQLLLLCSGEISDTLRSEIAIKYVKKNFLFDLPDAPVWVDGSGLSRYNLFTPRSVVRLWEKIIQWFHGSGYFKFWLSGAKRELLKIITKLKSLYFRKNGHIEQ